jgi:hypothetical protein
VHPGEAIYFPSEWWHATLNLDESVFMSTFVNYARTPQRAGATVSTPFGADDDEQELRRRRGRSALNAVAS